MQDLLPHYERELAVLRSLAEEFGLRYPRVAGRLAVSGEVLQDPHVERLIQAFALLTSRIHKRLDDDFPLFAESFLDLLYPHYLRPLPSSSIACFEGRANASQVNDTELIPRGTTLATREVRGVACQFRTTSVAQLLPVQVSSVEFRGTVTAPAGTDVPRGATATLTIQLDLISPKTTWATLGVDHVRLYIDGDPSLATALRETLTSRVLATMVQTGPVGAWRVDGSAKPRLVGLEEEDALIDFDARSHTAYRLLTEYFAFPEKFNFIDLPLPADALQATARTLRLHLSLGGLRNESDDARLLEVVSASNLLIGCAPVTNLFSTQANPIRITQASTTIPVLPRGGHAFAHEVYAIDRVYLVHETTDGEKIETFKPFYSLQHNDLLRDGEAKGRYWYSHRRSSESHSPGFETEIGLVDLDFNPSLPQTDTLSIDVRATNRDLPVQLSIGNPGGDLTAPGGGTWKEASLLRKPTPPYRFETGNGMLWRLISQLSLNHLSLTAGGVDALKEILHLYDLPRNTVNQRVLEAIIAVDYEPTQAFLPGEPFSSLARGMEVRLTVDEPSFVGTGLHLFAQVLDRFFALYVHINSFTQLKLISSRTGEVLIACPLRIGEVPLL